jgi:hypothetical protein
MKQPLGEPECAGVTRGESHGSCRRAIWADRSRVV